MSKKRGSYQLRNFFYKIWGSSHEYIVILTNNCYALNNMFSQVAEKEGKKVSCDRIIINDALLLYADYFAHFYLEHNKFPKILFVDLLVVNGENFVILFDKLERLIMNRLNEIKKNETFSENFEYEIRSRLYDSVDVYSFMSTQGLHGIFNPFISRKIQSVEREKTYSQQLSFLDDVSYAIIKANESFDTKTFNINILKNNKLFSENNKDWKCLPWNYRGKKYDVYFQTNNTKNNFIPIVYVCDSGKSDEKAYIKGLCIFGNLSKKNLENICSCIVDVLNKEKSRGDFEHIISILRQTDDLYCSKRIQLLSFILSIITVNDYCCSLGTSINEDGKPDIEKMSTNFGLRSDVLEGLKQLCENSSLLFSLKEVLYKEIQNFANPIITYDGEIKVSKLTNEYIDRMNDDTELVFYKAAMDSMQYLYNCYYNETRFVETKMKDIINLNSFLSQKVNVIGKQINILNSLTTLLVLADNGVIDINYLYNVDSKQTECALKAEKLSLLLIRKLFLFFPSFYLIRKRVYYPDFADKIKLTDEIDTIKKFISSLSSKENENCNMDLQEFKYLLYLKEYGKELVEYIMPYDKRYDKTSGDFWEIKPNRLRLFFEKQLEQPLSFREYAIRVNELKNFYIDKTNFFLDDITENYYGQQNVKKRKK